MSIQPGLLAQMPFNQRVDAIRVEILRVPDNRNLSDQQVQQMALKHASSYETRQPQQTSYQPSPPMGGLQMQMFMSMLGQMMQAMSQLGGGFSSFLGGSQTPNLVNQPANHYGTPSPGGYGGSSYGNGGSSYGGGGGPAYPQQPQPAYKPTPPPAPKPPAKKGGYA